MLSNIDRQLIQTGAIRFFVAVLVFLGASYSARADIKITEALVLDSSRTYGFYIGQQYRLKQISEDFPSLSGEIKLAEMEFAVAFRSAIRNMDTLLTDAVGKQWKDIKKKTQAEVSENVGNNKLSKSEALQFIETVRERAEGVLDSPVIETLLIFDPKYAKNPEQEFIDGYRYKYSSDGSGKAKGVPFSLEIPITWAASDGERPNIVQKFVSENGRGLELLMVMVKDFPLEPGENITQEEIVEFIRSGEIQDIVPEGGVYVDGGELMLEGAPGYWYKAEVEMKRLRDTVGLELINYTIFLDNRFVSIMGQVLVSENGERIQSENISNYEKLFDLVANSLVIPSVYSR